MIRHSKRKNDNNETSQSQKNQKTDEILRDYETEDEQTQEQQQQFLDKNNIIYNEEQLKIMKLQQSKENAKDSLLDNENNEEEEGLRNEALASLSNNNINPNSNDNNNQDNELTNMFDRHNSNPPSTNFIYKLLSDRMKQAGIQKRKEELSNLEYKAINIEEEKNKIIQYIKLNDNLDFERLNNELATIENCKIFSIINLPNRKSTRIECTPETSSLIKEKIGAQLVLNHLPKNDNYAKIALGYYNIKYNKNQLKNELIKNKALDENNFFINKIYDRSYPYMVVISIKKENLDNLFNDDIKIGAVNVNSTYYTPLPVCLKCCGINHSIDNCKSEIDI